jgi:methyl coenzyme M reductase beta subunit
MESGKTQVIATVPKPNLPMIPAAQSDRILTSAQDLLTAIELSEVPRNVLFSAAALHAALAGPGPAELDLRPGNLEVIHDAGLHVRALAEAKARVQQAEAASRAALMRLPAATVQAAADYDARTLAHRGAVAAAHAEGVDLAQLQAHLWWENATLWAVLRRWWKARRGA